MVLGLTHFFVALMTILTMGLQGAVAAPIVKKKPPISNNTVSNKSAPIIGETEDDVYDKSVDDIPPVPLKGKGKANQKISSQKEQDFIKKNNDEAVKTKNRNKRRKKILEGFRQAEDFHNKWYDLPEAQIAASLKKLTKFCKYACTKSHCIDDEVANKCHLVCPKSTTRQCPDPLKEVEAEDHEETLQNQGCSDDSEVQRKAAEQNLKSLDASQVLDQAEKALKRGEGEEGG